MHIRLSVKVALAAWLAGSSIFGAVAVAGESRLDEMREHRREERDAMLGRLRRMDTPDLRAWRVPAPPRPRPVAAVRAAAAARGSGGGRCHSAPGTPPQRVLDREVKGAGYRANVYNFAGSGASGCWQFMPGTWGGYKGFANAADAPVAVQNERAAQVWAGG